MGDVVGEVMGKHTRQFCIGVQNKIEYRQRLRIQLACSSI